MNYKRISLLFILFIGTALWLTLKTWLPSSLNQLPAIEKRADLIQTIESIFNLAILGANGITAYILWLTRGNPKNDTETKQFLHQTAPSEIFDRLGIGGKVNWIDRNASSVSDLHHYGKLIIIGRMKSGKTREAVELIQHAVAEDIVLSNRIFEPTSNLRLANIQALQEGLRSQFDFKSTSFLFIDDLPHHFYGTGLQQLSEAIAILQECKSSYVIATARIDQLTHIHKDWLAIQGFQIIELPDMSTAQIERLTDGAAKTFNIHLDKTALSELSAIQDGTPELILMSLRRLRAQGSAQANRDAVYRLAASSLKDAWAETRRYIQEHSLGSSYLFDALATFHAAGIDAHTTLVLRYAVCLWNMNKNRWHTLGKKTAQLRRTLDYLANFDIVVQDNKIIYPDVIIQGMISPEIARERLGAFLEYDHKFLRERLRPLYQDANIYSQALLAIYVSKKWAMEDTELNLSIQSPENYHAQETDATEQTYLRLSICGHAKHGKSTLAGRLMYELRAISDDQLSDYDREARSRGKDFNKYSIIFLKNRSASFGRKTGIPDDQSRTIFPARGNIDLGSSSLTLIDTPGFSRYLDNIIYGMYLSDQAIVVVEANSGVGHGTVTVCRILKAFNIPILSFCITKMDIVGYSESRFEEIKNEITELLILGLNLDTEIPIIPVSALEENDLKSHSLTMNINISWYKGENLINLLQQNKAVSRNEATKPIRFVVNGPEEVLFPPGVGTVLIGVLETGRLVPNQELVIEPQSTILKKDLSTTIKSVHKAKGITDYKSKPVNEAEGRSIIAVNVASWSRDDARKFLKHGGVFGSYEFRPRVAKRIMAKVTFFESTIINSEKEYVFGLGGVISSGHLKRIIADDPLEETLAKEEFTVSPQETLNVEIEFNTPICIESPSDFSRLSRFILREHNNILAYGEFVQQLE